MTLLRVFAALILSFAASAAQASFPGSVRVGSSLYRFDSQHFNLWSWTHSGTPIMSNEFSSNGVVLKIDGEWAGGVHGGEAIESVSLSGSVFQKVSVYRDSVRVTQTISLGNGWMDAWVDLEPFPDAVVNVAYVSLWSFASHFQGIDAFDEEGIGIPPVAGPIDSDGSWSVNVDGASRVTLDGNVKVTSRFGSPCETSFLWVRPETAADAKLYCRQHLIEGAGPPPSSWNVEMTVTSAARHCGLGPELAVLLAILATRRRRLN